MISHIVAVAKNRVIGKGNTLPWRLPDDMKYFKEKTLGNIVVMGRKNYESIPPKFRPLPDRENVVITRQKEFNAPNCIVMNSIFEVINFILEQKYVFFAPSSKINEAFIIGGAEIYAQTMKYVDRLYITEIDAEIEGDVFYPEIDLTQWKEISRVHHPADEKHLYAFDFVVYDKVSNE